MLAVAIDSERWLQAEHLQGLGQSQILAFGDCVMWVKVEGEDVRGRFGGVGPGRHLPQCCFVLDGIEPKVEIVTR